jgi:hypothetical protein
MAVTKARPATRNEKTAASGGARTGMGPRVVRGGHYSASPQGQELWSLWGASQGPHCSETQDSMNKMLVQQA